jgi:2-polyprenyl-6-methoxyphenol hydroxylase-like FAD-dependent oxidoreductase
LNKEGEIIHREDMVQNMTSWDLTYYILRANFDRVERKYCDVPEESGHDANVRHLHGHKVTGVEENDDKVVVTYTTNEGKEGSMTADFFIGADGPSSTIRSIFEPDVVRAYARGTIPEEEATPEKHKAFSERFTVFHSQGIQILAYLIPGVNGTMAPGKRLIDFVYYTNFPSNSLDDMSPELAELITDVNGTRHRITMPPGKTDPRA